MIKNMVPNVTSKRVSIPIGVNPAVIHRESFPCKIFNAKKYPDKIIKSPKMAGTIRVFIFFSACFSRRIRFKSEVCRITFPFERNIAEITARTNIAVWTIAPGLKSIIFSSDKDRFKSAVIKATTPLCKNPPARTPMISEAVQIKKFSRANRRMIADFRYPSNA